MIGARSVEDRSRKKIIGAQPPELWLFHGLIVQPKNAVILHKADDQNRLCRTDHESHGTSVDSRLFFLPHPDEFDFFGLSIARRFAMLPVSARHKFLLGHGALETEFIRTLTKPFASDFVVLRVVVAHGQMLAKVFLRVS